MDVVDVLLIESSPGIAATLYRRLLRDGHDVVSCNDSHNGPCRGAESNDACPLSNHIDIAVLAREPHVAPSLNEMGSVCALRHRIPLVTLYPGDEFGPGVSTEIRAAVARREVEAAYVAAVRHELGHTVDDIEVHREHNRIHVRLTIFDTPSAQAVGMIADRARDAVREHDRYTPVIDVSVVRVDRPID